MNCVRYMGPLCCVKCQFLGGKKTFKECKTDLKDAPPPLRPGQPRTAATKSFSVPTGCAKRSVLFCLHRVDFKPRKCISVKGQYFEGLK